MNIEPKTPWKNTNRMSLVRYESQFESAVNLMISIFVAGVIFTFCMIVGCNEAHALEIDMAKIAKIESSGCKFKIGDGGNSNGCHQISKATLKEYNHFNKSKYTKKDLLNDQISLKIATWYMNKRIPQMLKAYGIKDTVKNRLWAYNAGIKAVKEGRLPRLTKAYLKKYGV